VRALIVPVLAIGGGLAWLVQIVRAQHEAVVTIDRAHGNAVNQVGLINRRFNHGKAGPADAGDHALTRVIYGTQP
jgi:hypothetical protein